MSQSLRIAIADDDARMRDFLWNSLERLGHIVVGAARDGLELIALCESKHPELLITDIKMPGLDGIDAALVAWQRRPLPVILLSAFHDQELLQRAGEQHVMGYLVKPIKFSDLAPAIGIATAQFEQWRSLEDRRRETQQALEDRKLIERAKGLVMTRTGLSEPDAFRRLQQLARRHHKKLADIARLVVEADSRTQTSR